VEAKIAIPLACVFWAASVGWSQQTPAERRIEAGHWKRARTIVEARIREAPGDPLVYFLLSQVRNAFGDHAVPLQLAERAVALDGHTAKYHRQLAEVLGVTAQHANVVQQLFLAHRFQKEIDTALALDPRDVQALRDLLEFYLLAPGIAGGDSRKAVSTAGRIAALDAAEGFLARARVAPPAEAEALLRQAAQAQPPSYRARIELARLYLAPVHFDPGAAESTARQALNLDGGRAEAYAILAGIYADRTGGSELDGFLADASRGVPDDLAPYYRAAEHLIDAGRDAARAERYLRAYLAQEPEGNEPTPADAARLLDRVHVKGASLEP
jgi:tetratricopeptide (TPR) repeat protein